MNLHKIKEWLFFQIPFDNRLDFEIEIRCNNIVRSKVTSIFFITMELILIPLFVVSKKSALFIYPNYIYLMMYFIMIAAMCFYLFAFSKIKNTVEDKGKYHLCVTSFSVFLLAWCASVTLLDQLSSGQITIYGIATICLAIFPLFHTRILLPIYLSVHIPFLILLPIFQKSSDILFDNSFNSTVCIIISLIISRYLFKTKMDDFMNKAIIEDKNRVLIQLNEKLSKANEQLEQLSITDSLTGLLNRRKFDEISSLQWDISQQHAIPVSIIMLDIDLFKQYNDHFGHQVGDECLLQITKAISKSLRSSTDYAARYGGDEFIIILSHTGLEQAYHIAERLRKSIEELRIPMGNENEYVTVSIGICGTIPVADHNVLELISAADRALYQAKSQNRNNSVVCKL